MYDSAALPGVVRLIRAFVAPCMQKLCEETDSRKTRAAGAGAKLAARRSFAKDTGVSCERERRFESSSLQRRVRYSHDISKYGGGAIPGLRHWPRIEIVDDLRRRMLSQSPFP